LDTVKTSFAFRNGAQVAVALVFFCALCVHLALLWIWNAPANPIKRQFTQQIVGYVYAAGLQQNWSFFAPNAIDEDEYLVARGVDAHGNVSKWVEITQPLIESVQRNRFSSYEILLTGVSNAVVNMRNDLIYIPKRSDKLRWMYEGMPYRVMSRVAASVIVYSFPDRRFTSIQLGVVETTYPKFDQRFDRRSTKHLLLFDVRPFPADVIPFITRS
jgi:hypothetical protein